MSQPMNWTGLLRSSVLAASAFALMVPAAAVAQPLVDASVQTIAAEPPVPSGKPAALDPSGSMAKDLPIGKTPSADQSMPADGPRAAEPADKAMPVEQSTPAAPANEMPAAPKTRPVSGDAPPSTPMAPTRPAPTGAPITPAGSELPKLTPTPMAPASPTSTLPSPTGPEISVVTLVLPRESITGITQATMPMPSPMPPTYFTLPIDIKIAKDVSITSNNPISDKNTSDVKAWGAAIEACMMQKPSLVRMVGQDAVPFMIGGTEGTIKLNANDVAVCRA